MQKDINSLSDFNNRGGRRKRWKGGGGERGEGVERTRGRVRPPEGGEEKDKKVTLGGIEGEWEGKRYRQI